MSRHGVFNTLFTTNLYHIAEDFDAEAEALPPPATPVSVASLSSQSSLPASPRVHRGSKSRKNNYSELAESIRDLAKSRLQQSQRSKVAEATAVVQKFDCFSNAEKIKLLNIIVKDSTVSDVICALEGELCIEFVKSLINVDL